MELFKTALFEGAFDDQPEEIGERAVEWLRTLPETSKRRYGFTAYSVVIQLLGANALPRDRAIRESLLEFDAIAVMRGETRGYDVLSRTLYKDYPEHGRRELEALMVRRSVLASFLRSQCSVLSTIRTDASPHEQPSLDLPPAKENLRLFIEKEPRGRRLLADPGTLRFAKINHRHPAMQRSRSHAKSRQTRQHW